jgi:hypothetical protein
MVHMTNLADELRIIDADTRRARQRSLRENDAL